MEPHSDLRLALLNPWQRDFPLVREPFAHIAARLGMPADEVLAGYARLQREGALGRIGGVFAGNAGGAALLAAMAVPPERLDAVAAVVSSHPGVNHNYQREHHPESVTPIAADLESHRIHLHKGRFPVLAPDLSFNA